jgi:hypothetical protein
MALAILSTLILGIGPITAIGFAALGFIGLVGGAVAGAAAGGALENAMSDGLPKDELFVYEDALRQGRTVLIALTEDAAQAEAARKVLAQAGAESLDAAREKWWLGLRTAESEAYAAQGWNFTEDEDVYRRGFEAALRAEVAGKPYADAVGYLRTQYADVYHDEVFRRGYERGRAYYEGLKERRQV